MLLPWRRCLEAVLLRSLGTVLRFNQHVPLTLVGGQCSKNMNGHCRSVPQLRTKNMETNCDCQSNAGWLIRNKQLDKWSVWTCLNNTYHFWSFPLLVLNVTWHDCPGAQLNSELLVGEGEIKRPCKGNFKILKNPVLIIF